MEEKVTIVCDLCQAPVIDFIGCTIECYGFACCAKCSTNGEWYAYGITISAGSKDEVGQFIYDEDDDPADWWKKE